MKPPGKNRWRELLVLAGEPVTVCTACLLHGTAPVRNGKSRFWPAPAPLTP